MTQEEFEKLLKPDRYQVFLFSCPPSMPLSFARHPWFVANKKGEIARYEVIADPKMYALKGESKHVYINALAPWRGLTILRSRPASYILPSTLHGAIEGGEGSVAARMIDMLERSLREYPHRDRYAYMSPNSNTYAQWVINQFPESGFKLPWNSFGKGFRE